MKKILAGYFLIIFIVYFFISLPFYSGDIKNHLVWAESILSSGTIGFFSRSFPGFAYQNYPPVAMFLFAGGLLLYKLFEIVLLLLNNIPFFPSSLIPFFAWENVEISFLKLPGYLPSFGISIALLLLFKLFTKTKNIRNEIIVVSLFLLNPAAVYLGAVWGQIDLLPLMFILFAYYFVFTKKLYLAIFFAALSLLSKQTILIFWLIYLLLLFKQFNYKEVIKALVLSFVIFQVFYLPFELTFLIGPLELYKLNFSLVDHTTTINALNFWSFLSTPDGVNDQQLFLGLQYQLWGYLIFGIIFLSMTWKFLKEKFSYYKFFYLLFLTTLSFYFFLTRMHERYIIPAVLFATILIIFNKKHYLNWVFISLFAFLNLYRGLYQPDLVFLVNLLKDETFLKIISGSFFVVLIINLGIFFRLKIKDHE